MDSGRSRPLHGTPSSSKIWNRIATWLAKTSTLRRRCRRRTIGTREDQATLRRWICPTWFMTIWAAIRSKGSNSITHSWPEAKSRASRHRFREKWAATRTRVWWIRSSRWSVSIPPIARAAGRGRSCTRTETRRRSKVRPLPNWTTHYLKLQKCRRGRVSIGLIRVMSWISWLVATTRNP